MWTDRFPRIFDLYFASSRGVPGNYFEHKNVHRGLVEGEVFFIDLERTFAALDSAAWQDFKARVVGCVHRLDEWGYPRQLFERFHEADGYVVLKNEGCQDIKFIPEDQKKQTPDLQARDENGGLVLMEVKTVNESDGQMQYFKRGVPEFLPVGLEIPVGLQDKLLDTIAKASGQLNSVQNVAVRRRLIYLCIRLDFQIEAASLNQFLAVQRTPDIEILTRLLKP